MDRPYGWSGNVPPRTSPSPEDNNPRPLTPLEEPHIPTSTEHKIGEDAKLFNRPQITIKFDADLAKALIISDLEYNDKKIKEEITIFFKNAGLDQETKILETDPHRTFLKRKLETDNLCTLENPRNSFELQISTIFKYNINSSLDAQVEGIVKNLPFQSLNYSERKVVREIVVNVLKQNYERIYKLCVCSTYAISMLEDPKKLDELKTEILSSLARYDNSVSKSTQMERIFEMYLLVLNLLGKKDNEIRTTEEIREFLRSCEPELDEFYGLYKSVNEVIRTQLSKQFQQLLVQAQLDLQELVFTETGLDYITDNLNQIINQTIRNEIKEYNEAYLSIFIKINEYVLKPMCKKLLITHSQAIPSLRCTLLLSPTETTLNTCFDGTLFSPLVYSFLGKFEKMNKLEAEKLLLEQCDAKYIHMVKMLRNHRP